VTRALMQSGPKIAGAGAGAGAERSAGMAENNGARGLQT